MNNKLIKKLDRYDIVSWCCVLLFFSACSLIFRGSTVRALLGGLGIIVLMSVISISITIILDIIRHHPRVGELAGYITNGPEAICLVVGLIHGKLIFAASVPLGSNFANPILLIFAGLIGRDLVRVLRTGWEKTWPIVFLTMFAAGSFFWKSSLLYRLGWAISTLVLSGFLYRGKPDEGNPLRGQGFEISLYDIMPAVILLALAGYFLDPVVVYTAENSRVPEGTIGFLVLSFLSSWPEFRGTLSLIRMNKVKSAVMNILVSNLTNLWLAIAGTIIYMISAGS